MNKAKVSMRNAKERRAGKDVTKSRLGRYTENIVESALRYYENSGEAVVKHIPTPVRITKTKGKYVEGIKGKGLFVDYQGTLRGGTSVVFDAKSTKSKTSFPLANIPLHQLNYMRAHGRMGAESFVIIHFTTLERFFRIDWDELWDRVELSNIPGERKSIPISEFEEKYEEIQTEGGILRLFG